MPSFFQFTQGTESRSRPNDTSPLLGRFRAVPPREGLPRRRSSQLGLLAAGARGSVHVGYGALLAAELDEENRARGLLDRARGVGDDDDLDSDDDDDVPWWRRVLRRQVNLWVDPKQAAVKRVVDVWWSRYGLLVVLPAVLAVAWCAIPFPQYPLDGSDGSGYGPERGTEPGEPGTGSKAPGHGSARVQVNFWFFLFVYYGFYNLTALIWITKVFNLYNLNWWPNTLGFPVTISLIAIISLAVPIPIYLIPEARFLTTHNTAWITWTFLIMALPVAIACVILMTHERHLSLRHSLSETQRIFTTSWWTGSEPDLTRPPRRADHTHHARRARGFGGGGLDAFDPDAASLQVSDGAASRAAALGAHAGVGLRRRWLPASFVRFVWFCVALFVGLLAYVIGEAYAEIYLRTLPHDNLETIVYVYSWVATVHLLDALTAWILGIREGERVGSYPLSWIFKLYFMLTYQTYVRALYARLRSPQQFILLQVLSSSSLLILTPLTMSSLYHRAGTVLGLTDQSYPSFQKLGVRNVYIHFLAQNASMAAFLGAVVVLHFGPNRDVYPFFAFDDPNQLYDFGRTFYASGVTWACELATALCLRGLIRWCYGIDVGAEGTLDLAVWPELLPTSVAVMLHVLQNMFFSIIRLQFR